MADIDQTLTKFGIPVKGVKIQTLTSGHINSTYKIETSEGKAYILQSINTAVFTKPENIASNIRNAAALLKKDHPEYLFISPLKSPGGEDMVYDENGKPWRIFPYISDTLTIDELETPKQAFGAAKEFARLGRYLSKADQKDFLPTIDRFHDLDLRFEQLQNAIKNSSPERRTEAASWIKDCLDRQHLVDTYKKLTAGNGLKLRITHNDTKINNILFKKDKQETVAVIDLDTLMPGYFIYDLGDMVRTFVSPVSEEEKDHNKIVFRKEMYEALIEGYLSEMAADLNKTERSLIVYSGMMMTYIMAIRMLADFLNGDVYYKTHYSGQNLVRASNQITWLKKQEENEAAMQGIVERRLLEFS
jgi:Ser/Thr protein kinase RdoA (MazF antagonist)